MKYTVLLFLAISTSVLGNTLENLPQVKNSFSCFSGTFESYDTWVSMLKRNPNFKLSNFPFQKQEFNQFKEHLDCTIFDYEVDDVVGNGGFDRVNMGSMMYNLMPLANKGFVIIGSQYRWEKKAKKEDFITNGKNDEYGGIDQNDVSALIPIVEMLSVADHKRVGVYGVSRGGMQSYLFAKRHHNIKAMAIKAGISDVFSFQNRSEKSKQLLSTIIPDYENNAEPALKKRSAIYWPEKLPAAPILLIHAKDDKRVPYQNSETMGQKLEQLGRPFKLLSFESGGHDMAIHKEDIDLEIQRWFSQHL